MNDLLGGTLAEFIGLTVAILGGAAFMMGHALASTWRPAWQLLPYGLMLAAANRFLSYALFDGQLLSVSGFAVDAVVMVAIAGIAYRARLARQMVAQYPWLYERAGPFGWRRKER
ncbi:MAG: DUF6867 family protein [Pseudomonadota bacterium]